MSYDNVIIFGAGVSCDAGIPLLDNFVDTMWNFSVRGISPNGPIPMKDRELLQQANEILIGLERYNSRANFKLKNLEDVLSLLSFEALAGGDSRTKYQTWVKAITTTIELSSIHPYRTEFNLAKDVRNTNYHIFWDTILGTHHHQRPPALITFNYDLVFERALWDYFHCLVDDDFAKPAKHSCGIHYFLKPYDFTIKLQQAFHVLPIPGSRPAVNTRHNGFTPSFEYNTKAEVNIPYLKLHGSLNWCSGTPPRQEDLGCANQIPTLLPTQAAETPLLLPPVFNKMNSGDVIPVWARALEILREAKHIILVGYSLPRTDIYMQYFLKSAVGPNSSLQKIIVFDPALFSNDVRNEEMRKRYRECFSPQFQEQITFEPRVEPMFPEADRGKFSHFLQTLQNNAKELLFTP